MLVAVIVKVVEDVTADGVPLISPVEVLNDSPAGKLGEIVQAVTAPPLDVGALGVIALPFVSVNGLPL